tara:strand:- start:3828 stop:4256 length:429 start_codon:yes stop_codon:yes gene_type:complete
MKTSIEFQKAKKDKGLNSMLIMQVNGLSFIRLCIDEKSKYSDRVETAFIETETEIRVENYKQSFDIGKICFHLSHYNYSPVKTFLDAIKKDSEVSFKVIAFNGSNLLNEVNFVSHKLYGIIDEKIYLLDIFTGLNNLASPIQ